MSLIRNKSGRMILLTLMILLSLAVFSGMRRLGAIRIVLSQTIQTPEKTVRPEFTPQTNSYRVRILVSNLPGLSLVQDPLAVSPWGIAMTATGPFWLANNGTGTSSLYQGDVGGAVFFKQAGMPSITIPGFLGGLPTGTVANATDDFVVSSGTASGPARFIFSSTTGNIAGWNPGVPAAGSTVAQIAASHPNNFYTGLAIGSTGGTNLLYACDFSHQQIDVYSATYAITSVVGNFTDATIPADYSPYNIQALDGSLYVTYVKKEFPMGGGRPVFGVGNGFVRRFSMAGVRDLTFGIDHGPLNTPWGVAIAPASFGVFGGALLVGNFGKGGASINAFNPTTGVFLGSLADDSGVPLVIDGLWALTFGNGVAGGDQNTLYFTSGPAAHHFPGLAPDEEHGLFGSIKSFAPGASSTVQFSADEYMISESNESINVTVTRNGNASSAATVHVTTFDASGAGHASQKSDYEIAVDTLTFNPGETSKTLTVLLINDRFLEVTESISLMLSNPTGVGLGSPSAATIKVIDNDGGPFTGNLIDIDSFFVRQQYLDFLGRAPDSGGLAYWISQISGCDSNAACLTNRRVAVSAAFFIEQEFRATSYFTMLTTRAAYGRDQLYGEYAVDRAAIGTGSDAEKTAFISEFVNRNEFRATLDALTNAQYVDRLLANAGITGNKLFTTNLSGSQEVPPNASPATGKSSVALNAAETGATVNLSFSSLTSAQTAAHIHGPADPGVNAPIIFPLPNGQVTNFAITMTSAQVADLKAGKHYVNVHTTNFPNGEIRGQLALARDRDDLVNRLNAGTLTRADVLRIIVDSDDFARSTITFNRAFVLAQYFDYLRRDPDMAGFNSWITVLNSTGNFRGMVCAFIYSAEYQQRFSAATHNDTECAALTP